MKVKSFKLILLLILSLFMVDRITFFVLHGIENKVFTGQSVGKANVFGKAKDSVDLLILGSSRAARHINPDKFSTPVYNMGMDGTHFGYAAALMSTLEKEGQTILVHVDHHELYDETYEGEDVLSLMNETTSNPGLEDFVSHYFPEEILLSKISRCYVYNGKVLGMIKNWLEGVPFKKVSNGFSPLSPTENQKETFEKILKNEGVFKMTSISKNEEVNELFESFVDFSIKKSQENNSKLIFFTSPSLNKVSKSIREKTANFFKTKGVEYLDDLDFFEDFNIEYWKDRTHMSKKGAEEYSVYLVENL